MPKFPKGFEPDKVTPKIKGMPEGFEPDKEPLKLSTPTNDTLTGVMHGAGVGLSGLAKGLDVLRGVSTGPLLGSALEKATGKKAYSGQDVVNAINPTNLEKFPSASEMLARVGVPEGGKLSDVVSGYAEPGSAWYKPEKGGMLDPTLRGTGGTVADMAIDPLTYLSMGGAGVAREALAKSATRQALEKPSVLSTIGRGVDLVASPITAPATALAKGVNMLPGGKVLTGAATLPSDALKAWGKKLYGSLLQPVEHQGTKFGKTGVADTLYEAGIKTPKGLNTKAAEAGDVLGAARDKILTNAGEAGGVSSMESAVGGLRQEIQKIRASGDPNTQGIADAMETKMNEYLQLEKGTPAVAATPATTREVPSSILGENGKPIVKEIQVPGDAGAPAIPGKAVTPMESSGYKSSLYSNLSPGTFKDTTSTGLGNQLRANLARGLKTETEQAVARSLGPKAASDLSELNNAWGKILSTRQGQFTAANQGDRLASRIVTPTGSDAVLGSLGVLGENGATHTSLPMIALKHVGDALRYGAMPMGYGLRQFGESSLAAPAFNAWAFQKIKEKAGKPAKEKP